MGVGGMLLTCVLVLMEQVMACVENNKEKKMFSM
jgi:hypothetical protein